MTARRYQMIRGLALTLLPVICLFSCGEDDDQVLGPAAGEEEVYAWLWAFDADQGSLRVYDPTTGELQATFHADPHPLMGEELAGPAGEPTVWMGSGGTGYAFAAGFVAHGDHAHMELPASLGTVIAGGGSAHLSADPAGETVCFANDDSQDFTLVDTQTLAVTTLGHGSPHSSSLLTHDTVMATHMNEKWARLIDIESGEITATVVIDTLAHGDAYHEATQRAFISCLNGFSVVNLANSEADGTVAYPGTGRVNFLFHGPDADMALAPVKLPDGQASEVWLLNMLDETVSAVSISGSSLAWNRGGGNISLSTDGSLAALTDLAAARAYLLELATGEVITVTTAATDMACALDHAGEYLWLLEKGAGQIHLYHLHDGEPVAEADYSVHPGSDRIFVTSLDPAVEIIRDY